MLKPKEYSPSAKTKLIIGMKKARSLMDRIIEMTEKDSYCIDIMQQNLAVIGLLRSAHQQLLERHLKTCFKNAMHSQNENVKEAMVEEILHVSKISNK